MNRRPGRKAAVNTARRNEKQETRIKIPYRRREKKRRPEKPEIWGISGRTTRLEIPHLLNLRRKKTRNKKTTAILPINFGRRIPVVGQFDFYVISNPRTPQGGCFAGGVRNPVVFMKQRDLSQAFCSPRRGSQKTLLEMSMEKSVKGKYSPKRRFFLLSSLTDGLTL